MNTWPLSLDNWFDFDYSYNSSSDWRAIKMSLTSLSSCKNCGKVLVRDHTNNSHYQNCEFEGKRVCPILCQDCWSKTCDYALNKGN